MNIGFTYGYLQFPLPLTALAFLALSFKLVDYPRGKHDSPHFPPMVLSDQFSFGAVASFGHVSAFALHCWPIDQDGNAHAAKIAAEFHAAERIGPENGRCRVAADIAGTAMMIAASAIRSLFSIMVSPFDAGAHATRYGEAAAMVSARRNVPVSK